MAADGAGAGVILGEGGAVKVAPRGGGVVAAFLDGFLARLPGDAWTLALRTAAARLAVSGDLGARGEVGAEGSRPAQRTGAARFAVAGAAGEPAPRALAVRNRAVAVAGDGLAAFYDDAARSSAGGPWTRRRSRASAASGPGCSWRSRRATTRRRAPRSAALPPRAARLALTRG
ncbi:hypothetical protein JL721_12339 [Aureococcus anophagefferens]|nr:hypothetical protein JL721_12339 [Aureococcus anophagefferens]